MIQIPGMMQETVSRAADTQTPLLLVSDVA